MNTRLSFHSAWIRCHWRFEQQGTSRPGTNVGRCRGYLYLCCFHMFFLNVVECVWTKPLPINLCFQMLWDLFSIIHLSSSMRFVEGREDKHRLGRPLWNAAWHQFYEHWDAMRPILYLHHCINTDYLGILGHYSFDIFWWYMTTTCHFNESKYIHI